MAPLLGPVTQIDTFFFFHVPLGPVVLEPPDTRRYRDRRREEEGHEYNEPGVPPGLPAPRALQLIAGENLEDEQQRVEDRQMMMAFISMYPSPSILK